MIAQAHETEKGGVQDTQMNWEEWIQLQFHSPTLTSSLYFALTRFTFVLFHFTSASFLCPLLSRCMNTYLRQWGNFHFSVYKINHEKTGCSRLRHWIMTAGYRKFFFLSSHCHFFTLFSSSPLIFTVYLFMWRLLQRRSEMTGGERRKDALKENKKKKPRCLVVWW